MIIKEVVGENILKYSRLELTNLPGKGLISISGKNESGKTSIGEIICFGLFGRTFSLQKDELNKLIKWGCGSCSVTIVFTAKGDQVFRVVRRLDADGKPGAQLFQDDQAVPVATGDDVVSQAISEIIGFRFDEYAESFYLAQRELRSPSSDEETIKVMAGIAALARIDEQFKQTLRGEQKEVADTEEEIWGIEKKIEELGFDEQRLDTLEEMATQCRVDASALQSFVDRCRQGIEIYRLLYAKVRRYRKFRLAALLFSVLSFVASIEFLLAWWVLRHPRPFGSAGIALVKFSRMLVGRSDYFLSTGLILLAVSLVGLGVLVLLVILTKKCRSHAAELTEMISSFGGDEQQRLMASMEEASRLIAERAELSDELQEDSLEETDEVREADDNAPVEQHASSAESRKDRSEIVGRVGFFHVEPNELAGLLGSDINNLESLCKDGFEQVIRLGQECDHERQQGEMVDEFRGRIASEKEKISEMNHRIEVLEQSIKLLQDGIAHMSRRFNADILAYTTNAIPLFTNGHYEHLKIDSDMGVSVFSREKHDFMDFEELSSGTQRQMLLALRLAMSQKLIQTAATYKQFIFFDEPFAFFDRDRIHSSLKSLPEISDEISQIWIVAQELDKDTRVDIDIRCSAESDELKMDCGL